MNENILKVELINATLCNFKTDDGSVIEGIKIYYYSDNSFNDNSITYSIEDCFISSTRLPLYKSVFNDMKEYFINCKRSGLVPVITLKYSIKSIKSKPVITDISID